MATVFNEVSICGLRVTHLKQLLAYVEDRENSGWYYGNKKQFEQRHEELKRWIEAIINYANNEGVVIPKKGD